MKRLIIATAAAALLGGATAQADNLARPEYKLKEAKLMVEKAQEKAKDEALRASVLEEEVKKLKEALAKMEKQEAARTSPLLPKSETIEELSTAFIPDDAPGLDEESRKVVERMKKMILPCAQFVSGATLDTAIQFLVGASREYDDPSLPIEDRGVNIILGRPKQDNAGEPSDEKEPAYPQIGNIALMNVSAYDLLKVVCDTTGWQYFFDNGTVCVGVDAPLTTWTLAIDDEQMDKMLGDTLRVVAEADPWGIDEQGGDGNAKDKSLMKFFRDSGVSWPRGSEISYSDVNGTLRIKNTKSNISAARRIVKSAWQNCLNKEAKGSAPNVEIGVTVIEASMEALGRCGYFGVRENANTSPYAAAAILDKLLTAVNPGSVTIAAAPRLMSRMGESIRLNDLSKFRVADRETGEIGDTVVEGGGIELEAEADLISLDNKTMSLSLEFCMWGRPQKVSSISEQVVECPVLASFMGQVAIKSGTTAMFTASANNNDKMTLVFVTPRIIKPDGTPLE